MSKTFMAIGAHIGDMELTAGCVLATESLKKNKIVTVALTAGERGNPPDKSVFDYRKQKEEEAKEFANMLDGEAIIFEYADGELPVNDEVKIKIANLIREHRPDIIFTHWKNSMHKDHKNTYLNVVDASFYASVDMGDKVIGDRHYAPLYLCENWEDREGFEPYIYVDATKGYDLWCKAISKHWFIVNSSSFKYYDYYTHLTYVRGALNKTKHAQAFTIEDYQKFIRIKEL